MNIGDVYVMKTIEQIANIPNLNKTSDVRYQSEFIDNIAQYYDAHNNERDCIIKWTVKSLSDTIILLVNNQEIMSRHTKWVELFMDKVDPIP